MEESNRHEKHGPHIVFESTVKVYLDESIMEALSCKHEAEIDAIIKRLKASIKDLKRTPIK